MILVVAAIIEKDRRLLICQRSREGKLAWKWEFPGGKVETDETPEEALARELREELGATLRKSRELARIEHTYAEHSEPLEIRFYAAAIAETEVFPSPAFEKVAWALPKELGNYDFLDANRALVAHLATGKLKPGELLEEI